MTLPWPEGWPRTPPGKRVRGKFGNGYHGISIAAATSRVQVEVRRFGGSGLRIDTDLRIRRDGLPYSGQARPDDPGAVVSFRLPGGKPVVFPCDRYTDVGQNLAAIAATLEAKRAIERHGVSTLDREFEGYLALGAGDGTTYGVVPATAIAVPPSPRQILGIAPDAPIEVAEGAYRALMKAAHPDRPGGNAEKAAQLNAAIQAIRQAAPGGP